MTSGKWFQRKRPKNWVMHKITQTCTYYITNQNIISIFQWKNVIQPCFEQTSVTLLRCIYEPNFITICAAV